MRRTRLIILPLLLTLAGGCEYIELTDVSVDVDEASIDAGALAAALAELAYATLRGEAPDAALAPAPDAVAGTGEAFTKELDFTRECAAGGTVQFVGHVAGHIEREQKRSVSEFQLRQVHAECAISAGETQLVLSGDPDIKITGRFEHENGVPVGLQRLNLKGGVTYAAGEQRGGCELDLLVKWDHSNGKRFVRGRICDVDLDVEVDLDD